MIKFSHSHSNVTSEEITHQQTLLKSKIDQFTDALNNEYSSPYGFINLPFDQDSSETVYSCIEEKKEYDPRVCIVVGIGGSNLGTRAVYEGLKGILHNQFARIQLYFLDTVNSQYMQQLCTIVEQELQNKRTVIVNVVTKSGITLETVTNFQVIAHCLKRYHPTNYQDYIVITTDIGSPLWNWGRKQNIAVLPIPAQVGGRFSVLSAVSLFPLGLLGINIDQLLDGARAITPSCMRDDDNNSAALTASILYDWSKRGLDILNFFFFQPELEGLGRWCRQLVGESIGKAYDTHGQQVRIGITPIVSIGSTDLHSVGQRYFGGAHTIGTLFCTVKEKSDSIVVPSTPLDDTITSLVVGKQMSTITQELTMGTKQAYAAEQLPFVSVELPEKNEYYLGQFLQCQMVAVVYLAHLLQVNPFDQPAVEQYKHKTRELLRNE